MTRSSRFVVGTALLGVLAFTVLSTRAEGAEGEKGSDAAQQAAPRYGKTPDAATPYRNFTEPYKRFFLEQVQFLGAGREKQPAQLPPTVRIGLCGPLETAPDSDLGQDMLDGVTLAIEHANAQGGYEQIPFELVVRPDLGLWGATSNVMVNFKYADHVWAAIGSIDGANTHIALRVALKTQMLLVNTGDTDPTLTETNIPWLMRCMADDRQQSYALAQRIFKEEGLKKVVALRVNNHYGKVGIAEFRDAARRLGHPLQADLRWVPGGRDFATQLDRITELGAEAIVIWGSAHDAAAVVKEIRRRKMPVRIFGSDRLASRAFLEQAGAAAEGVVVAATYDPTRQDPKLEAFTSAFAKRFGRQPEAFAAHAYDGTNLLLAAIRKAGLNSARIRDAVYQYTRYNGVTGAIEFDATMNDIGPVYLATVKNGKFAYRLAKINAEPQAEAPAQPYRRMSDAAPSARSPERLATPGAGAAPGAGAGAYRIGCFLPLDDAGRAVLRGVKLALAEDAARHADLPPIALATADARGPWGGDTRPLVDMVMTDQVIAVIGSTERKGTHLIETLAAKLHFPIVSLCGTDPSITAIPLPWIFSVAPADDDSSAAVPAPDRPAGLGKNPHAAAGYDAAALLAQRIRAGAHNRRALRDALSGGDWHHGLTGTFRFDPLGNRIDSNPQAANNSAPAGDPHTSPRVALRTNR